MARCTSMRAWVENPRTHKEPGAAVNICHSGTPMERCEVQTRKPLKLVGQLA